MSDKCTKCGRDMDEEGGYNFPDGLQCNDCGKSRTTKILRKPTEEEMTTTENCKECGGEMVLYEWKCRQGVCVVCNLKKELKL